MKFTPAFIEARTLDEAYFQLILKCYETGYDISVDEGSNKGGRRLELPVAAGFIHYPHTRPLAPIMPPGIPATTTDEKIERYFTDYLMNPEVGENEEYKYATWINGEIENKSLPMIHKESTNKWTTVDRTFATWQTESQLDWCIRHFKEKGFGNNHCFITVGDPQINFNYDFPYKDETDRKTSPCLRGLDIKVKDNKVLLGIIYRSWDLFAGFPTNMGGFTLLNQYVAEQLGIEPGPLSFYSQGLHCYDYQIEAIVGYLRKDIK
jgi:thymidylate synthase